MAKGGGAAMSTQPRSPVVTKEEISAAIVLGVLPLALAVVPSLVTHGISMWQWVGVPLLLIFECVGTIWVHRRDSRRIDADLAEWRRFRPHPQPKVR
jgi:hypothetical protein